jgi:hypothetical protein
MKRTLPTHHDPINGIPIKTYRVSIFVWDYLQARNTHVSITPEAGRKVIQNGR